MSDWEDKSLQDIAAKKKFAIVDGPFGTQLHASEYQEDGVPVIRVVNTSYQSRFDDNELVFISEKKADVLRRSEVVPNDIIIAKTGATIGKSCIFPVAYSRGIIASSCIKLSVDPKKDDYRFVARLIESFEGQQKIIDGAGGSTRTTINTKPFAAIRFRFPHKDEQTKIAEILATIDQAIEQTETIIAKQTRIKTGLMQDLLTRGIDEHGSIRSEGTHQFKDSSLGRIPVEWEVASLKSKGHPARAHIKTGPFGSALKSEHWVEYGVPVITIGALGEGQFIGSDLLFVSIKTAQRLASYSLVEGDIVFSRVADVGRSVVVTAGEFGWIMSSNLMRISLNQTLVNPRFAQLCIGHDPRIRMQIRRLVNAGGRDVANSAVMNSLVFCWPSKDEQDIIVSRLGALNVEITNGVSNRRKLVSIKTGLMCDLLTGNVRAKQLLNKDKEPIAGIV